VVRRGLWLAALALASAGCVVSGDVLSASGDDDDPGDPDADPGADAGGVPAECAEPPVCAAGTVCGRLHDVETSRQLTEIDGPLPAIRLFDDAGAILGGPVAPDACGRYAVPIDLPAGGLLVEVRPDDGDPYVATVTGHPTLTGAGRRADAFALAAATDQRWADALGEGDSVVGDGALLAIFVDMLGASVAPLPGAPVPDVAVTIDGLGGGDVYYFADDVATSHREPSSALGATAASGAALILPVEPLAAYGGSGPLCGFTPVLGADRAGVLQVSPLIGACAQ
jgi:hypothetical protein